MAGSVRVNSVRRPIRRIVASAVLLLCAARGLRADQPAAPSPDDAAPLSAANAPLTLADSHDTARAADASWPEDAQTLQRPARGKKQNKAQSIAPGKGTSNLMDMMWPLAVVLGLILGMAYMAKRGLGRFQKLAPDGAIKMLARHYLSGKQSLCLVQVGERMILLGVTSDSIRALADVGSVSETRDAAAALGAAGRTAFADVLSSVSREEAEQLQASAERRPQRDPVRALAERLKSLANPGRSVEPT